MDGGDTLRQTPGEADFLERLEKKIRRGVGDGCDLWVGATTGPAPRNYGRISRGGRMVLAHRIVWEIANGAIQDGGFLVQTCRNANCVKLTHLILLERKRIRRNETGGDFERNVLRGEGPDACDIWTGSLNAPPPKNYGRINFRRRARLAHRVAWELENGPIPPGLDVLHRCDNPPCVRVSHLFLGTNLDNHDDKMRKGRQARGEKLWTAKLTEEQVLEIRRRALVGRRGILKELAAEYGVHASQMSRLTRGLTWKHLPSG